MGLLEVVGRKWLERHVYEALAEDLGEAGDITALASVPTGQSGSAKVITKQEGVLAGADWAVVCGELTKPAVEWHFLKADGERVHKGETVAEVTGLMHGILISERTALNGLQHYSGIATMAARAMELVKGTNAKVLDTRKTFPGQRLAEKYAVRMGGAFNHRAGLYDEFLIKENHIASAGGIMQALQAAKKWRNENAAGSHIPIEIEVTNLAELELALDEQPDYILLDNFSNDALKKAVSMRRGACLLEASGGITLQNLREVAETGVDRISLGALTHSVIPLDLSLLVVEA
ncbi:carboxylating nicotinate-nucleotide diphosphorylase [bacterium]|nr:carboxylating nicotinate-nucleotide diphosphorylase [bacterium]